MKDLNGSLSELATDGFVYAIRMWRSAVRNVTAGCVILKRKVQTQRMGAIRSLDDLSKKDPELAAEIMDNAQKSLEKERIQAIDALASVYDEEVINAAKYGDTACTAQEMTYRAAQKAVAAGKNSPGYTINVFRPVVVKGFLGE